MKSKSLERILASTPKEIEIFTDLYADLVVRINEILREKGISKKALAEKLDKQPSEISKWLSGEHNFTLRSLAKLSAELEENLIAVPERSKVSVEIVKPVVSQFSKETKPQGKLVYLPSSTSAGDESSTPFGNVS